jgi:hypothetical protein
VSASFPCPTTGIHSRKKDREILERRIEQLSQNATRFQKQNPDVPEFNIMLQTPFSCMVCHQKG